MKALEIPEQYWQHMKDSCSYAQYCAQVDLREAQVCRDFRLWGIFVAGAIGLLIAFMIARIVFGEQLGLSQQETAGCGPDGG